MNVADIMTEPVITVAAETKIAEAARLMLQHRISGLPVVDGGGRVVGILTEGDLLRRSELGTDRNRARWVELLIGPGRLALDCFIRLPLGSHEQHDAAGRRQLPQVLFSPQQTANRFADKTSINCMIPPLRIPLNKGGRAKLKS